MKNVLYLTIFLTIGSTGILLAQFEGKQFLSGSAGINFTNNNPKSQVSTNGYGYNFDISIGRFKTNTKAAGWRLTNSLGGAKNLFRTYDENGTSSDFEKSGINNIGVGVGRFWQYYKHFNDKIGIFGGPDIDLFFSKERQYDISPDSRYLSENKVNRIQLSIGVSAGIYYHFSEKWWITAGLAFSNPLAISYAFNSSRNMADNIVYKQNELNYSLSPNVTFPSVNFGLRYFLQ